MGFEKITLNIVKSGVYIVPKTARVGGFQGFWVMQELGGTSQNRALFVVDFCFVFEIE